ncbi:hypothetical protein YPPY66_1798, partial [Yersinia pestis PY-66]
MITQQLAQAAGGGA